ncbi:MAG: hypothetical protein DRN90_05220, partial [Thermoproteota archaeon]
TIYCITYNSKGKGIQMDGIDHEPAHSGLISSISLKRKLSSVLELLKNRNLAIIFITWILFALAGPLFWQFESDYAKRLGASPEIIGMMNSVFTLINMLVQIPGGYLADKKGRKNLLSGEPSLWAFRT